MACKMYAVYLAANWQLLKLDFLNYLKIVRQIYFMYHAITFQCYEFLRTMTAASLPLDCSGKYCKT